MKMAGYSFRSALGHIRVSPETSFKTVAAHQAKIENELFESFPFDGSVVSA